MLVEPFLDKGCMAEDDGVRLVTGVHELHDAYLQLIRKTVVVC